MVLDSVTEAKKYYALHPRFQQAFEFINAYSGKFAPGKYVIDGDELFMSVVNGKLKKEEEARLEAHDRYIDIQVVLSGSERHGWKSRKECREVQTSYDAEKDILFYRDLPTSYVDVRAGEFVVFFPEDAHAPMIGKGEITKAIIKVRI